MKLDGEDRSVEYIKHRYKELNFFHMQYVVNSLLSHEKGIKIIPAFIRTTLYNVPATMGSHHETLVNHDEAGRCKYNDKCRQCVCECKQSYRAIIVRCPKYESKRSGK